MVSRHSMQDSKTMKMKHPVLVMIILLVVCHNCHVVESFVSPPVGYAVRSSTLSSASLLLAAAPKKGGDIVDQLLRSVQQPEEQRQDDDENNVRNQKETIKNFMTDLEDTFSTSVNGEHKQETAESLSRFDPLLGLYDVSYTLTLKENQNPVGGKWTRQNGFAQKLLTTRRTFQHILPFNATGLGGNAVKQKNSTTIVAEAVNVISLDAFWSLIRLTVILRGDAIPVPVHERDTNVLPLSNLAVRVLFDAPRIILGKRGRLVNLNIGPSSSVVLDSTYCDNRIRIGMGGTSGTRFVFARCRDDDQEANEFQALLRRQPMRRYKAFSVLSTLILAGLYTATRAALFNRGLRLLGLGVSAVSSLMCLALSFSSGGIEQDS